MAAGLARASFRMQVYALINGGTGSTFLLSSVAFLRTAAHHVGTTTGARSLHVWPDAFSGTFRSRACPFIASSRPFIGFEQALGLIAVSPDYSRVDVIR